MEATLLAAAADGDHKEKRLQFADPVSVERGQRSHEGNSNFCGRRKHGSFVAIIYD